MKNVKCQLCGYVVPASDYAAQVDHMYVSHNAPMGDEHAAKTMALLNFEEVNI